MLHRITSSRWFALADLGLVSLSGCLWALWPEAGILPLLTIALLPWGVRLLAGQLPFRRTSLDLLVVIFLATSWAGYWAAYDQQAAWSKVWMVFFAVLLYYALAAQPPENRTTVCFYFFCIGVGISVYFFLTHDFVAQPRKVQIVNEIGRRLMDIRPGLDWRPIHPNYVSGLAAILTPFALYPAIKPMPQGRFTTILIRGFTAVGFGLAILAVLMTTSRGSIMAIAGATGLLVCGWISTRYKSKLPLNRGVFFPIFVFACLCGFLLLLFAGPAQSGGVISPNYHYGTSSRAELFTRSLYLVSDFPFTGGGLGAFPALYSHYILGIPFYNVPNSHNLFLDVAIEQGFVGGISFLMIYLISIWSAARSIADPAVSPTRPLSLLVFAALIIAFLHGLVDDYLYNGNGTILGLALVGMFTSIRPESIDADTRKSQFGWGIIVIAIILMLISLSSLRSAWYANLGAVHMAKSELIGFPTDQWYPPSRHPELDKAEYFLKAALQFDPQHSVANHRLGLIAMLRGDYSSASGYLARAYAAAPGHRGIIKALGYSYAWLGDTEKATIWLRDIPEARRELEAYVWWWELQGRQDLSDNAYQQAAYMAAQTNQK